MTKSISGKNVARNTLISVGAQAVSLLTSLILNLIIPKYISEVQYAHWQTYLLYVSYVGLLHFGLLDGIVLKYSQYDYEELDKRTMKDYFFLLLCQLICFSISLLLVNTFFFSGTSKQIFYFIVISLITKNLLTFVSYLFQITNRIYRYAYLIIVQKIFFLGSSILLLLIGNKSFYLFCIIDIFTDVVGITYGIINNIEIFKTARNKHLILKDELYDTYISGIPLLISNFTSNLILGSSKIIVKLYWPILIFGKISFGFSLANLFLTFVMSISVVLFPSLKRMKDKHLVNVYFYIRYALVACLLIAMSLYFPAAFILGKWVPNYSESIKYAGILLPIIIYSTKESLLNNNYLKMFRKERIMLKLNVVSIILELTLILLSLILIKNIYVVLLITVTIICFKSIIGEAIVSNILGLNFYIENVLEILLSVIFIFCSLFSSHFKGFVIFTFFMIIYFVALRDKFIKVFSYKKELN
ncbi:membrane protein [Enterococcus cecorum]|nr:membrane protein [Enterococcus cecorum]